MVVHRPAPETLVKEGEEDYVMNGPNVWITVGNISVWIRRTDSRVIVQMFPVFKEAESDPLAQCIASQILNRE